MTQFIERVKRVGALVSFVLAAALIAPVCMTAWIEASPARAAAGGEQEKPSGGAGSERARIVDVNTADLDTLCTLPGIGRGIAQRILDYRKEHGPFKKVDELLNVRGIGERSLARIRDRVTVGSKS